MLEALASGVIYGTKWDMKSPFVNPMCGSGTLAIEAALIASNRKPGLFRMNYAFMHILGYDEEVFFEERRQLKAAIQKNSQVKIIASDISAETVNILINNKKKASVDTLIEFTVCYFKETKIPEE